MIARIEPQGSHPNADCVNEKTQLKPGLFVYGGEGGIRTLGRDKPTHAFQACSLSLSDTSPKLFAQ